MRTIIYRISDLICVGILRSPLWTIEDEITNNVLSHFGGKAEDYSSIETNETNFHLEMQNGIVTIVKDPDPSLPPTLEERIVATEQALAALMGV